MPKIITTSGNGYFPEIDFKTAAETVAQDLITQELQKNNLSIPEARKRLYDNVFPYGYSNIYQRFKKALRSPKKDTWDTLTMSPYRDRIFAKYLNIPDEQLHNHWFVMNIEKSPYTPSMSKNNHTYYRLVPDDLSLEEIEQFVDEGQNLPINSNKLSGVLSNYFGTHTIGKGQDEKGTYVSYYDLWDLNPLETEKDLLEPSGISTPTHYYDRIYLDDYYKLQNAILGTEWLPGPTVVYNNRTKKQINNRQNSPDSNTKEGYKNNPEYKTPAGHERPWIK